MSKLSRKRKPKPGVSNDTSERSSEVSGNEISAGKEPVPVPSDGGDAIMESSSQISMENIVTSTPLDAIQEDVVKIDDLEAPSNVSEMGQTCNDKSDTKIVDNKPIEISEPIPAKGSKRAKVLDDSDDDICPKQNTAKPSRKSKILDDSDSDENVEPVQAQPHKSQKAKKTRKAAFSGSDSDEEDLEFMPTSTTRSKKPRLSLEEKMYQRDLELALKQSTEGNTSVVIEPKKQTKKKPLKEKICTRKAPEYDKNPPDEKRVPEVKLCKIKVDLENKPAPKSKKLENLAQASKQQVQTFEASKLKDATSKPAKIIEEVKTPEISRQPLLPKKLTPPVWKAPRFDNVSNQGSNNSVSPSMGYRVGLSRNIKVKSPLHSNVKLQ
jgi:hypothetical protein